MCLINWRLWAIAFSLCSVGQKPQTIRWCRFSKLRKSIVNSQILQIDCGAIITSRRAFGINPWVACTLVIRLILFPKWILSFWTLNTLEIPISKGILIAMQRIFKENIAFIICIYEFLPLPVTLKKNEKTRKNSFWFRNLATLHLFLWEQKSWIDINPVYGVLGLPNTGRVTEIWQMNMAALCMGHFRSIWNAEAQRCLKFMANDKFWCIAWN